MSAWYQEINLVQEPIDIGVDGQGRQKYAINISAVKSFSRAFAEEIIGLLETAGVGAFGTDIFGGSVTDVPDGKGPFLHFIDTGGATPLRTHNEIGPPAYQRPTAQLVARAKSFSAARSMAQDAYDALVGIRNRNVVG